MEESVCRVDALYGISRDFSRTRIIIPSRDARQLAGVCHMKLCASRREKVRVHEPSLPGNGSGRLQHQILLLHRIHPDSGGTGSR